MATLAENVILIGAYYHFLFGLLHLVFPSAFVWSETLSSVDRTNRNLLPVFNLWVAFAIFSWSYLSFKYPHDLISTGLGQGVCLSIAFIWVFRYMMQIYYLGFDGAYELPRKYLFGITHIPGVVFAPVFWTGTLLYLVPVLKDNVFLWIVTMVGIVVLCASAWFLRGALSSRRDIQKVTAR